MDSSDAEQLSTSDWWQGPELPDVRLPGWLPGSELVNAWFRWPDHVPRPRLNPLNWLKWSVEESLVASAGALARLRLPSPELRRRMRAEVGDSLDFFEARGWIAQPERYHRAPPPLERPRIVREDAFGLRYEHLSFESGYEPHPGEPGRARWLGYAANATAHAWILRRPGPPRPWLVCVHGYRMGFPRPDLSAVRADWLQREHGLNVLAYVLPLHGPRAVGGSGDRFFSSGHLNLIHAEAQAVWDLRRILAWLRASEGAPAIGAYGLSLGGATVALLAAFEGELACAVAGIPMTDFVRAARRPAPRFPRLVAEAMGMSWHAVERITRVISPLALAPRVPRERLYIFAGVLDRLVLPDQPRDLWEHWGRPRIAWYQGSHLTFNLEFEVHALLDEALARSFRT